MGKLLCPKGHKFRFLRQLGGTDLKTLYNKHIIVGINTGHGGNIALCYITTYA